MLKMWNENKMMIMMLGLPILVILGSMCMMDCSSSAPSPSEEMDAGMIDAGVDAELTTDTLDATLENSEDGDVATEVDVSE